MKIAQQKQWAAFAATFVVAVALGAAGCASGNGPGRSSPLPNVPAGSITRAEENTLSDDAKILATRQATSAFVSLAAARAFEADLNLIHASYPAVQNVHAHLSYEPKSLLVIVKPTAPWVGKWNASLNAPPMAETDLTTGEAALDALLKKYDATRTTDAYDFDSGRYYVLRFAESLNMNAVAAEFAQSSSNIVSAEVNGLVGEGDNILYAPANGTTGKGYLFSQGYGDCPAGCISHYTHTYTFQADGNISEQIAGTPPGGSVNQLPNKQNSLMKNRITVKGKAK